MKTRKIKRGDIYYANLYPIIWCEQDGIRPVVVVQNEMANAYSPVVLIAPLTSRVNTKPRLAHTFILRRMEKLHTILLYKWNRLGY